MGNKATCIEYNESRRTERNCKRSQNFRNIKPPKHSEIQRNIQDKKLKIMHCNGIRKWFFYKTYFIFKKKKKKN